MTARELIERVADELEKVGFVVGLAATDALQLSAKQLMDISKAFNYFMAEQIQTAPCDHVGEVYYETMSGKFCGICQRKMEKETVNG